jgi:hypothetical protein
MIVYAIQVASWLVAGWLLVTGIFKGDGVLQAATWLAAIGGGLLMDTIGPWIPADQRTVIVRAAVTVLGCASAGVVLSWRADTAGRTVVSLLGVVLIGVDLLRFDFGEYRSMMVLAVVVLAVVAVTAAAHLPIDRHVLTREDKQAAAAVHTLWITASTWAVLLSCGVVALCLQSTPAWGRVLLEVGCVAAGITVVAVSWTIFQMWRCPGFAAAYAVPASKVQIDVRMAMVAGGLVLSLAAAVGAIALSLDLGPDIEFPTLGAVGAWVVVGTYRLLRIIRREAIQQRRAALSGPVSKAVRNMAAETPVYRLLPGMTKRKNKRD